MNHAERSVLREGIVAGLIGAAVVAVWFLIFDIARGRAFLTPSLLGSAVFHGAHAPLEPGIHVGPILGYTILHGLAFMAFGVIAATIMVVAEREPALFIAFVILFAAFEAAFFGVLGVLGQTVQGALVWWSVLVGNLLASIAMLWFLLRAHRALPQTLVGSWGRVLREGIVAGLVGAAVVAVWFLAIDTIQGEALRTPTLLGTTLLRQKALLPAVVLYTLVHGAGFVLFGVVGAFLIAGAEKQPLLILGLVILFTAFEIFFFGLVIIAASHVLDQLAGWTILLGNVLAATAMLAYYFKEHRGLARRLSTAWAEED
ncbi:MAG: hypothetical protein ACRELS_15150 [Candidatus Rokuibacteriota bacterium]